MECEPLAARALVVRVATAELFNPPVPSAVAPSLNVTVPAGVTVPDEGVTVAVSVTDCPLDIAVAEAVKVVVVPVGDAAETLTVTGVDVLAAKLLLPL